MKKYDLFKKVYQTVVKPVFFFISPEDIHEFFLSFGSVAGKYICFRKLIELLFSYQNKKLEQNILGINFKNPVGLSEGYDKDAKLLDMLPSIGFGFTQVGTVTDKPYSSPLFTGFKLLGEQVEKGKNYNGNPQCSFSYRLTIKKADGTINFTLAISLSADA